MLPFFCLFLIYFYQEHFQLLGKHLRRALPDLSLLHPRPKRSLDAGHRFACRCDCGFLLCLYCVCTRVHVCVWGSPSGLTNSELPLFTSISLLSYGLYEGKWSRQCGIQGPRNLVPKGLSCPISCHSLPFPCQPLTRMGLAVHHAHQANSHLAAFAQARILCYPHPQSSVLLIF